MGRINFKKGTALAPTPPTMVTVGDEKESNVLTVGWVGIMATQPPTTYISVRPERHSYEILKRTGEFVINLPPASLAHTVDYVGIYTGAKVDKFEKCSLTKVASEHVKAPTIKECPIAIECRVKQILPMGTHDVFIADILGFSCDESIVGADGRIMYDRADLMAYAHGEYFALGESLGKFGFGTKPVSEKPKLKPTAKAKEKPAAAEEKTKTEPFYKSLPRKMLKNTGKGGKKKCKARKT